MPKTTLSATTLKAKLHRRGSGFSEPGRVRIHRAISWLARAERETDDPDARFVFLWIAFNAAYAQEMDAADSTRQLLKAFFEKLVALDDEGRIGRLLFEQFTGPIRNLMANPFAFAPFWKALREHDSSERWREEFNGTSKTVERAVLEGGSGYVLEVVFDRLYVLRNQLIHGGATWNSGVNRDQIKKGVSILASVIPVIVDLMLEHPEVDFGDVMYPVV